MEPGDRVALALPAGAPFVEALHGCMRLGAVAVPIDLRLAEAERAARVEGCAAVVDAPLAGAEGPAAERPASLRARRRRGSLTGGGAEAPSGVGGDGPGGAPACHTHDLDATAIVVHTSGTTSAGRPVELTYGNWLWSALGSAVALGLDPDERWLCTLPLSHVGGLSILLRSAIYATTAVVHDGFDAARRRRASCRRDGRRSSPSCPRRSPACSTPACATRPRCAPRSSAAGRSRRRCSSARARRACRP